MGRENLVIFSSTISLLSISNLCYCGNELIVPLTNSNQCNIQCNSSSDMTRMDCCGGQNVSSVYHIPNYRSY